MKFIVLSFILLICCPCYCQHDSEKIIGSWQSISDKKYIIEISKTQIKEYYDIKEESTYKYYITTFPCDSSYTKVKNISFLKKVSVGDVDCYEIVSLTNDYLTLVYTSNGNILEFKRNKKKSKQE